LPTPFAKHEKRGRWAWPITAEGFGRANFGPPGPAGAAKKNGWARARPGLEKNGWAWARPGPLKKNATIILAGSNKTKQNSIITVNAIHVFVLYKIKSADIKLFQAEANVILITQLSNYNVVGKLFSFIANLTRAL